MFRKPVMFFKRNKPAEAGTQPGGDSSGSAAGTPSPEDTAQGAGAETNITNADGNGADSKSLARARTGKSEDEHIEYPTGLRLALLLLSTFVSMFLTALDRLIISTAIPKITDDFNSLEDVGWYGSAFMLTSCAFQLMFGKMYTFYAVKTVFLTTVGLFEIGSAICGAAPSSVVFIVGRAIAGVGSAGIFSGAVSEPAPMDSSSLFRDLRTARG